MSIEPFGATPYPSSLYLTAAIKETLRIFRTAIDSRQGLVMLVGDIGHGKTSLLHLLHADFIACPNVDTVFIQTPSFPTPFSFVKAVCEQLDVLPQRSLYAQQQALEKTLVQKAQEDRNVVAFIDEAQLLDRSKLETLRWLLNIETAHAKLIQFVLAGQLELWTRMSSKWNRALKSRVYSVRTMQTMSADEARRMLEYRCEYADAEFPFERSAIDRIYEHSGGVPRGILHIAHEAWKRRDDSTTKLMSAEFIDRVQEQLQQTPEIAHA
jgi:general secretion pathway protein A